MSTSRIAGTLLAAVTLLLLTSTAWALLSAADYTINHQDPCRQHIVLIQCNTGQPVHSQSPDGNSGDQLR